MSALIAARLHLHSAFVEVYRAHDVVVRVAHRQHKPCGGETITNVLLCRLHEHTEITMSALMASTREHLHGALVEVYRAHGVIVRVAHCQHVAGQPA